MASVTVQQLDRQLSSHMSSTSQATAAETKSKAVSLIQRQNAADAQRLGYDLLQQLVKTNWELMPQSEHSQLMTLALQAINTVGSGPNYTNQQLKEGVSAFMAAILARANEVRFDAMLTQLHTLSNEGPASTQMVCTALQMLKDELVPADCDTENPSQLRQLTAALPKTLPFLVKALDKHVGLAIAACSEGKLDTARQHEAAANAALASITSCLEISPISGLVDSRTINACALSLRSLDLANAHMRPHGEVPSELDLVEYRADEFRMFCFKIETCPKSHIHDWAQCPFAHAGEKARRRDPRIYEYTGTPCPDFRKGSCKRGDGCAFAHGVFENWLHPVRYHTQLCKDGTCCSRKVCFFAHVESELRDAPESAPATPSTSEPPSPSHRHRTPHSDLSCASSDCGSSNTSPSSPSLCDTIDSLLSDIDAERSIDFDDIEARLPKDEVELLLLDMDFFSPCTKAPAPPAVPAQVVPPAPRTRAPPKIKIPVDPSNPNAKHMRGYKAPKPTAVAVPPRHRRNQQVRPAPQPYMPQQQLFAPDLLPVAHYSPEPMTTVERLNRLAILSAQLMQQQCAF